MSEGKLHSRIRNQKMRSQDQTAALNAIDEAKQAWPISAEIYTEENPPPKDPLVAANELNKRRAQWFKDNYGDKQ